VSTHAPLSEGFTRAAYALIGALNAAPVIGVAGRDALERLYGVSALDHDLTLLMRHRAAMLGLLGAVMILAAFRPALRGLAGAAGLISMGTFLLLAWPFALHSAPLQRVAWLDVGALLALGLALGIEMRRSSQRN
jgi:hypothetical protein